MRSTGRSRNACGGQVPLYQPRPAAMFPLPPATLARCSCQHPSEHPPRRHTTAATRNARPVLLPAPIRAHAPPPYSRRRPQRPPGAPASTDHSTCPAAILPPLPTTLARCSCQHHQSTRPAAMFPLPPATLARCSCQHPSEHPPCRHTPAAAHNARPVLLPAPIRAPALPPFSCCRPQRPPGAPASTHQSTRPAAIHPLPPTKLAQ